MYRTILVVHAHFNGPRCVLVVSSTAWLGLIGLGHWAGHCEDEIVLSMMLEMGVSRKTERLLANGSVKYLWWVAFCGSGLKGLCSLVVLGVV
jgi:hypothetical protein